MDIRPINFSYTYIWVTLILSIVLETLPWQPEAIRPMWTLIVFIYWLINCNTKVSYITALVIGILLDLIIGSYIGLHSLIFLTMTVFIRNSHRWLMASGDVTKYFYLFLSVLFAKFITYIVQLFTLKATIDWYWISIILSNCVIWFALSYVLTVVGKFLHPPKKKKQNDQLYHYLNPYPTNNNNSSPPNKE